MSQIVENEEFLISFTCLLIAWTKATAGSSSAKTEKGRRERIMKKDIVWEEKRGVQL